MAALAGRLGAILTVDGPFPPRIASIEFANGRAQVVSFVDASSILRTLLYPNRCMNAKVDKIFI